MNGTQKGIVDLKKDAENRAGQNIAMAPSPAQMADAARAESAREAEGNINGALELGGEAGELSRAAAQDAEQRAEEAEVLGGLVREFMEFSATREIFLANAEERIHQYEEEAKFALIKAAEAKEAGDAGLEAQYLESSRIATENASLCRAEIALVSIMEKEAGEASAHFGAGDLGKAREHLEKAVFFRDCVNHLQGISEFNLEGLITEREFTQAIIRKAPEITENPGMLLGEEMRLLYLKSNVELNASATIASAEGIIARIQGAGGITDERKAMLSSWEQERKAAAESALELISSEGAGMEELEIANELFAITDSIRSFRMESEMMIEGAEVQIAALERIPGMGKKERENYIAEESRHISSLPISEEEKNAKIASMAQKVNRIAGMGREELEEQIGWQKELIANVRKAQALVGKDSASVEDIRKANEAFAFEVYKFSTRMELRMNSEPLQEAAAAQFAPKGEIPKAQREMLAAWIEETGMHSAAEARELAKRNTHLTKEQREEVLGWLARAQEQISEAEKILVKPEISSEELMHARKLLDFAKAAREAAYVVNRASSNIKPRTFGNGVPGLSAEEQKKAQSYLKGIIDESIRMQGEGLGFYASSLGKSEEEKNTRMRLGNDLRKRGAMMLAGGEAYARAIARSGENKKYRENLVDAAKEIQHGIEGLRVEGSGLDANFAYVRSGDTKVELYSRFALQDRFDQHGLAYRTRAGKALDEASSLAREILHGMGKWKGKSYQERFEAFDNLLKKQKECARNFTAHNFRGSELREDGEGINAEGSTLAENIAYHRKKVQEKTGKTRVVTPIEQAQNGAVDALNAYAAYLSAKPGEEAGLGRAADIAYAKAHGRENNARQGYLALRGAKKSMDGTAANLVAAQPEWAGVEFIETEEEGLRVSTEEGESSQNQEFLEQKSRAEENIEARMEEHNVSGKLEGVYYAAQGEGSLRRATQEFDDALQDASREVEYRYAGYVTLEKTDEKLARKILQLEEDARRMGGSQVIEGQIAELKAQRKKIWEKAGKAAEYEEMEAFCKGGREKIAKMDEEAEEIRQKINVNLALIEGESQTAGYAPELSIGIDERVGRLESENREFANTLANLEVEQTRIRKEMDGMRVGENRLDGITQGEYLGVGTELEEAREIAVRTAEEADRALGGVIGQGKYIELEQLINGAEMHAEQVAAMSKSKGIAVGAYEINIGTFERRAISYFRNARELIANGKHFEAKKEYEKGVDQLRQMAATAKRRNTSERASYEEFEREAKARVAAWNVLMEDAPALSEDPAKSKENEAAMAAYEERRERALAVVGVLDNADTNRASLKGLRLGYLGTDELEGTERVVDDVLAQRDNISLASLKTAIGDMEAYGAQIQSGNTRADWIETGVRIGLELLIPKLMITSIVTAPIDYMGQTGEVSWDAVASAGIMVAGRALRMQPIMEIMAHSRKYNTLVRAYGMLEVGYFSGVSAYHAGVGLQEWDTTGTLSVDTASSALFALLPLAHRPGVQKFKKRLVQKAITRAGKAEKFQFFTLGMEVAETSVAPWEAYRPPSEQLREKAASLRAEAAKRAKSGEMGAIELERAARDLEMHAIRERAGEGGAPEVSRPGGRAEAPKPAAASKAQSRERARAKIAERLEREGLAGKLVPKAAEMRTEETARQAEDAAGITKTRDSLYKDFTARDVDFYVGRGREQITYTEAEVSRAAEITYYAEKANNGERTYEQIPRGIREQVLELSLHPQFKQAIKANNGKAKLYLALGQVAHGAELANYLVAQAARLRARSETETGFRKTFSVDEAQRFERIAEFADQHSWQPVLAKVGGAAQRVNARMRGVDREMPQDMLQMRGLREGTRFEIEINVPGKARPEVWTLEYRGYTEGNLWYDYVGVPKEYSAKLGSTGMVEGKRYLEFKSKRGRNLTPLDAFAENILNARHSLDALPGRGQRVAEGTPVEVAREPTQPELQLQKAITRLNNRIKALEAIEARAKPSSKKNLEPVIKKRRAELEERKAELAELKAVEDAKARAAAPARERIIVPEHFEREFEISEREVEAARKLGEKPAEKVGEREAQDVRLEEKSQKPAKERAENYLERKAEVSGEGEAVAEITTFRPISEEGMGIRNQVLGGREVTQLIERSIRRDALAGGEYDVLVLSMDKSLMNDVNPIVQSYGGDVSLSAYQLYMRTLVGKSLTGIKSAKAYVYKPFQRGDEYYAVLVVKKGQGAKVRERLQNAEIKSESEREVLDRVARDREAFPQGDQFLELFGRRESFVSGDVEIHMETLTKAEPARVEKFSITEGLMKADDPSGVGVEIRREANVRGIAQAEMATPKFPGRNRAENAYVLDVGAAFRQPFDSPLVRIADGVIFEGKKGLRERYMVEGKIVGGQRLNNLLYGHEGNNAVATILDNAIAAYSKANLPEGCTIYRLGDMGYKYAIEAGKGKTLSPRERVAIEQDLNRVLQEALDNPVEFLGKRIGELDAEIRKPGVPQEAKEAAIALRGRLETARDRLAEIYLKGEKPGLELEPYIQMSQEPITGGIRELHANIAEIRIMGALENLGMPPEIRERITKSLKKENGLRTVNTLLSDIRSGNTEVAERIMNREGGAELYRMLEKILKGPDGKFVRDAEDLPYYIREMYRDSPARTIEFFDSLFQYTSKNETHILMDWAKVETAAMVIATLENPAYADLRARYPEVYQSAKTGMMRGAEDLVADFNVVARAAYRNRNQTDIGVVEAVKRFVEGEGGRELRERILKDPDVLVALEQKFLIPDGRVSRAAKIAEIEFENRKTLTFLPSPPELAIAAAPAIEAARPRAYESEAGRALVQKYGETPAMKAETARARGEKAEFREQLGEVEARIERLTEGMSENQKIDFRERWEKVVSNEMAKAETEGARTRGDSLALEYDISLNLLDSLSIRLEAVRPYGAEKPVALLDAFIRMGPERARETLLLSKQRGGPTTGELVITEVVRTGVAEQVASAMKEGGDTPQLLRRVVDRLSEDIITKRLGTSREELSMLLETGKFGEVVEKLNDTLAGEGIVINLVNGEAIPAYVTRSVQVGRAKGLVVEQVPGMKDPLSGRAAEFNEQGKTILLDRRLEAEEVIHEISHYDQYTAGFWERASVAEREAVAVATQLGFSKGLRAEAMLSELAELRSGRKGTEYADAAREIFDYRPGRNQYSLGEILAEAGVKPGEGIDSIRGKLAKWATKNAPEGTSGAEARLMLDTLVKVRLREFVDAKYTEKIGVAWSDVFSPVVEGGGPANVSWRVEAPAGVAGIETGPERAGAPRPGEPSREREGPAAVGGPSGPAAVIREVPPELRQVERVEAVHAVRRRTAGGELTPEQERYLTEQFSSEWKRFSGIQEEIAAGNIARVLQVAPNLLSVERISERTVIPLYYEKATGKIIGIGKGYTPPKGVEAERADIIVNGREGRITRIEDHGSSAGKAKFWQTQMSLEGMQVHEALPGYDRVSVDAVVNLANRAASNELTSQQMDYVRTQFREANVYARDVETVASNTSKTLRVFSAALKGIASAGGRQTETITAFYNEKTGRIEKFGKEYMGSEPVREIKIIVDLAEGRIREVKPAGEGPVPDVFNKRVKPLEGIRFREPVVREPAPVTEPKHKVVILRPGERGRAGAPADKEAAPREREMPAENYAGENVAMPLGGRILVYDQAYLLGKHAAGTESAGSKLGKVETPRQLADVVRQHVDAETLAKTEGVTRLANLEAGEVTGTDSLVEIISIREGRKKVGVGGELKEGVDYDATVRDANGVEHPAIVRYEVVREGSPDGKFPPIRQAVAYTLAEPPPTTKLNVVIGKIDLADPRADWVNQEALRKKLGNKAVDEAGGFYSIFTIFPGRYTPAADARNGASVDALVGMTGLEFWNGRDASAGKARVNRHALMKKPSGEMANRLEGEAAKGRGGAPEAGVERAGAPAEREAAPRERDEVGERFRARIEEAHKIGDEVLRDETLSSIAIEQAQMGLFKEAINTIVGEGGVLAPGASNARYEALSEIALERARGGWFSDAIETAGLMMTGDKRAKTLSSISIEQARTGALEEAAKTISLIPPEKKFNRERVEAIAFLAGKQAEEGNFRDALANVEKIRGLKMVLRYRAEEIETEFTRERNETLRHIASVQARAGKFKDAMRTAGQIEKGDASLFEALASISSEQANAGLFPEAMKTAEMIPQKEHRKLGYGAFAHIALQQAKAGINPSPAFSRAEKIIREQYLQGPEKALALATLARCRAEAGLDSRPLFREATAMVSAGSGEYASAPKALSEIAVEMEKAGLDPRPLFAEAKDAAGRIVARRTQDYRRDMAAEISAAAAKEEAFLAIAVNEAKAGLFTDAVETWNGLSAETFEFLKKSKYREGMLSAIKSRLGSVPAEKVAGEAERAAEALLGRYELAPELVAKLYRDAAYAERDPAKKLALEGRAIVASMLAGETSFDSRMVAGETKWGASEKELARNRELFSLWDNMEPGALGFLKDALPRISPKNIDASFAKLQPLLETYNALRRELSLGISENLGAVFQLVELDSASTRLLLAQLGAKEKAELGAEKLAFYFLSLGEKKPGDVKTYRDIILSLPEAKRGEAMKRFLTRMSGEYEAQKASLFTGGPPHPKMAASAIIASSDIAQMIGLAESLGIKGKTPMEILGELDAAIRKNYSGEVPPSVREFTFSAREVTQSLPGEYENSLRGVLGNAAASGKERAASAMESAMPLLELSAQIREAGLTPDLLKALERKVPEGLLRAGNAENVLQYLAKHQKELGPEGNLALVGEVLRSAGLGELAEKYARGEPLSAAEKGLLYTKLGEIERHVEDWARSALPRGDWQTLKEIVARTKEYSVLKQLKNELYVKEASEKASEKNIQLVFGPKAIQHLMLGKIAGTCFGDYASILLPKDIIVVPILEGGEANGNLLFLSREIGGKKSLVLFGFDPAERMVMGLTQEKRFELADKIMEQVISYCKENGFELYATLEGGGLSNREGLEAYITAAYFDFKGTTFGEGDAVRRVEPITLHPDYQYRIEKAYPLIPERGGIGARPKPIWPATIRGLPGPGARERAGAPVDRGDTPRVREPVEEPAPVKTTPPTVSPKEAAKPPHEIPMEEKISLRRMEHLAHIADKVVYEGGKPPEMLSPRERVAYLELVEGARRDRALIESGAPGARRLSLGELIRTQAGHLLVKEFRSAEEKQEYKAGISESQDYNGEMFEAWSNVKSVTVIGDMHGDYVSPLDLLIRSGAMAKKAAPDSSYLRFDPAARSGRNRKEKFMEHLSGNYEITLGKGDHIVLMGDYLDRGASSMETITFIRWLKAEAKKKGATVHLLRGNHEELFLAAYEVFEGMDTAGMNRFMENLEKFDAEVEALKDAKYVELVRKGMDHKKASATAYWGAVSDLRYSGRYPVISKFFDKRIVMPNIGMGETLSSIREWYSSGKNDPNWWENAKAGMEADGTLQTIRELKAAVALDNMYFAHGGIDTRIDSVEGINNYYTQLFSGDNHWRTNVYGIGPERSYDTQYAGPDWNGNSPGVREWRKAMAKELGVDDVIIFVGHSKGEEIASAGEGVVRVDSTISSGYQGGETGHGEALRVEPGKARVRPGKRAEARTNARERELDSSEFRFEGLENDYTEIDNIPIALVPPGKGTGRSASPSSRNDAPRVREEKSIVSSGEPTEVARPPTLLLVKGGLEKDSFEGRVSMARERGNPWSEYMEKLLEKKASEMNVPKWLLFNAYGRYAESMKDFSANGLRDFCDFAEYGKAHANRLRGELKEKAKLAVKSVSAAKKAAEPTKKDVAKPEMSDLEIKTRLKKIEEQFGAENTAELFEVFSPAEVRAEMERSGIAKKAIEAFLSGYSKEIVDYYASNVAGKKDSALVETIRRGGEAEAEKWLSEQGYPKEAIAPILREQYVEQLVGYDVATSREYKVLSRLDRSIWPRVFIEEGVLKRLAKDSALAETFSKTLPEVVNVIDRGLGTGVIKGPSTTREFANVRNIDLGSGARAILFFNGNEISVSSISTSGEHEGVYKRKLDALKKVGGNIDRTMPEAGKLVSVDEIINIMLPERFSEKYAESQF